MNSRKSEHADLVQDREIQQMWSQVVEADSSLNTNELKWYLKPSISWLGDRQKWREVGGVEAVVDPSFPQPAASTSSVKRIILEDGSSRILKELLQDTIFYTDSTESQALALAGEQAIGGLQFLNCSRGEHEDFYQGIFSIEEAGGGRLHLKPYEIGDDGRVAGMMQEVDSRRTLALRMFSVKGIREEKLSEIFRELGGRAMEVETSMPTDIREQLETEEHVRDRINAHTPGQLSRSEMGQDFPHLRHQATEYLGLANKVLDDDNELRGYLVDETVSRYGGDFRGINAVVDREDNLVVVFDQISLLLDPNKWGGIKEVECAPWGLNSASYEAAFLIPDLLASGNEAVAQSVVDGVGKHKGDFNGSSWFEDSEVSIRALRFYSAMKAMEIAGLSTFNIQDQSLEVNHKEYLMRAIYGYGEIAIRLINDW
jgi:hypothetical protein